MTCYQVECPSEACLGRIAFLKHSILTARQSLICRMDHVLPTANEIRTGSRAVLVASADLCVIRLSQEAGNLASATKP